MKVKELYVYVKGRPYSIILRANYKTIAEIDRLRALLCHIEDTEQVEFLLKPKRPGDFTRQGKINRIEKFEYPEFKPKEG